MHIKDLNPDKRNARKHNPRNIGMIEKSLQEVGAARSIVIDEDNNILAGNGTIEAAASAGITNVHVVEADGNTIVAVKRSGLTGEQKKRLAVLDNRTAETAEWDAEVLKELETEIKLDDLFTENEMLDIGIHDVKEVSEDEVPPVPTQAKSVLGDLYELGRHRVLCGDSTNSDDVAKLMDGKKADLVFTDPPYGVSIGKKNRLLNSIQPSGRNLADIEADDMNAEELEKMLMDVFVLAKTFMQDHCSVFVCAPQGGSLGMMMMMMMMKSGLPIRHVLNWVKNSPTFSIGRLDYEYQHEPILFTWVKTHKRIGGGQFKTSVWTVDKPRSSKEHPTMKPVELPINAILNHTDPSDILYEPFTGSGTTLIAAEQTNRTCYGMELEPKYIDVIVTRYCKFTGNNKVIRNGSEITWEM